jgi:hypothetical protein
MPFFVSHFIQWKTSESERWIAYYIVGTSGVRPRRRPSSQFLPAGWAIWLCGEAGYTLCHDL